MAVTISNKKEFSAGGFRAVIGTVTLDAVTSGAVSCGLEVIYGGAVTPASIDSALRAKYAFNVGSAETAINGMLAITTGTAGDVYEVFLVGR
jgi:hypothetical protein